MSRATALSLRSQLSRMGLQILQSFRNSATVIARIEPELAPELRRAPFVNYVEPPHSASAGQFSAQVVDSSAIIVGAPSVWSLFSLAGQNAVITIIDTGLDSIHFWNGSGDGPANLTYCGWVSGMATSCNSPNVHGAAVAGVVAARDNCCGGKGIAYSPFAVNFIRAAHDNGDFSDQAIAVALDWATSAASTYSNQIVNMSIQGCTMGAEVSEAVARASAAGVILIAIAGNTGYTCSSNSTPGTSGVTFPGRYPEVVAVAGTTWGDAAASGSRNGPEVAISAPYFATTMTNNGYTTLWSGTSFAAPAVAAVAALVWGQNPTWTAAAVTAKVRASAVGYGQTYGSGRVSAINAVQPQLSASITGPATISSAGTYTWSTAPSGATSPYSYSWAYKSAGSSTWVSLGASSSASRTISSSTPNFTIRVVVTSATWQGSVTPMKSVSNLISEGCNPYCE